MPVTTTKAANMSYENLPSNLKITMEAILKDNDVSSWIIRGGSDFTQISIRFMNMDILGDNSEVKYRRVPQSRLIRDRNMAQQGIWLLFHMS